ncbi:histidine--tRNA ligase [Hazenella coriacea]|uniref:Histidine--tRNA ligase n=1 Tax=Hazenella coriacea TaxID=1179467 RepID=A0A4R3L5J0_9BACL|nr:histidine--tRNA ligase [Hazenella coriacea]TCS94909.1 histidyl-tRNA synthetase [Hazenella coriacea]
MSYKIPRGTLDLLPDTTTKWQWVEEKARQISRRYGFSEVRTPIFETTELFQRGVGETTDIVEKEMYTFLDRKKRSLTLRPEGTAGIVRSFVENKVYAQPQPTKWFYMGPMFRYERPQAGRQRQFHQFGLEAFGSTNPALDAEVIAMGMQFFEELGLQGVRVEINSVGDAECRPVYLQKLIEYFEPYKDQLAADAQARLYRNPLRILDTKDPATKEIANQAPSILDHLNEDCAHHFEMVKKYLDALGINYVVNDRLVRGLDYYTHTAFEFMLDVKGAQASTIGGGGRYNGLVQEIGGPEMSGIGFGIGLERVVLALDEQNVSLPIDKGVDCYVISIGEEAKVTGFQLLQDLRKAGFTGDQDYLNRKMKAQLKQADRVQARWVAILGEDELKEGKVNLKNLGTGTQELVPLAEVVTYLRNNK